MKSMLPLSFHVRRVMAVFGVVAASLFIFSQVVAAASWNNIEPLKSRRADVERILGKPLQDKVGEQGTLHFKVMGGTVTISFVSARFVANKKLSPELEGKVLQIVLQHENSSDTPESLKLTTNSDFQRED